jgi:hypothetical protein
MLMNMKTEKKKEYVVPQMETLELAYETQLLEGSDQLFNTEGEETKDSDGELG